MNLFEWLQTHIRLNFSPEAQANLFTSFVVILSLWLLRWLILAIVTRQTENISVRYHWQKITVYVAVGLGIFLVGRVWLQGLHSLATFLGLASAGLAIALQGPVTDLAGWLFILWRRPFVVGDRIQIGEHAGDVVDIRIFKFSLLEIKNWVEADQSTGRLLHVPNGHVFKEVIANYTQEFKYIWHEIPVLITHESDWEKAKQILMETTITHAHEFNLEAEKEIRRAARHLLIFYKTLTPTVYTRVNENGILLTIRCLVAPRRRRGLEQAIWEDVLRAFAQEPHIHFGYATQRLYTHLVEPPHAP